MPPSTPASGSAPSQRALAAIVFTDVVSFSARMHTDEVATLKLLQRDFAEMRRLCAEHEGTVLKTTGDGLLLTFTSAVQAVACALAMQRQFAAEAKAPDSDAPLQHRIGIHLGDVLMRDQDVMGDGVNIASRLQSEAEPGGICISQTVYDVVKNKLQMQAVSLGPRELKNIAQAMPAYRLVLEAQTLDSAAAGNVSPKPKPVKSAGPRKFATVAGAAVLAVFLVAAALIYRRYQTREPAPGAASSPQPAVPLPAPSASSTPSPPPSAVSATAAGGGDAVGSLVNGYASRKDAMGKIHALYLDKYDFNGMVLALREKGEDPSSPPELKQLLRSAEQLVRLKSWLEASLRRHNRQHPLAVTDLSGNSDRDLSVYLAEDQRVVFIEGATQTPRDWADLKPAEFGAIVVSAIHEVKEVPRLVAAGAQTFARLYALPSMAQALAGKKVRSAASVDFKVVAHYPIGGDLRYDYLRVDPAMRRLYVSHGTRVNVLDADTGAPLSEIAPMNGIHGIAVVPALRRGFITAGSDRAVVMFDLDTLKIIKAIHGMGVKPDAIEYDPQTQRIYVANGASGGITVIDPATGAIAATVPIEGKLEGLAFDERGRLFVNTEDRSLIQVIDTHSLKPVASWPIAPVEGGTGLAIDAVHHRLFSAGANDKLAVLNSDTGAVVATPDIGSDPDGDAFDPSSGLIFTSNMVGTVTVIHEDSPDTYSVAQTVPTAFGARTIALDAKTGRIFLATGKFKPAPAPTAENPKPRRQGEPGTFEVLVVGR